MLNFKIFLCHYFSVFTNRETHTFFTKYKIKSYRELLITYSWYTIHDTTYSSLKFPEWQVTPSVLNWWASNLYFFLIVFFFSNSSTYLILSINLLFPFVHLILNTKSLRIPSLKHLYALYYTWPLPVLFTLLCPLTPFPNVSLSPVSNVSKNFTSLISRTILHIFAIFNNSPSP